MPESTTSDFVVTAYVNQNYSGSYETRHSGGYTYREYDNEPGTFWFDNDQDVWFEDGRRDEGEGEWSTFVGFFWDDVPPPPPRFPTETPIEVDNGLVGPNVDASLMGADNGSFL